MEVVSSEFCTVKNTNVVKYYSTMLFSHRVVGKVNIPFWSKEICESVHCTVCMRACEPTYNWYSELIKAVIS